MRAVESDSPVTASQGSRHSEKDKEGIETPVPESHLAAGDRAGTAGTFVARRQLLILSRSLSPRPCAELARVPVQGGHHLSSHHRLANQCGMDYDGC